MFTAPRLVLACLALAVALPAQADTAPATPVDAIASVRGTELIVPSDFKPIGKESLYRFKVRQKSGGPLFEMVTVEDTNPSWAIQLVATSTTAVAKGDVALLRFRARVSQTFHETGQGQLRAVVQRASGDFQRSATARFDITPEWTEYFLPVRFANDYAAGEVGVFFGFGYQAQTLEIQDVSLAHYGKRVAYEDLPRTRVTYLGQAPNAAWRRDAEARIEQIRKGDVVVNVSDAEGRPLTGAQVSLEMTRHHFEFGTAVPFSLLMDEGPNREKYRETLLSIFNAVGPENDLKWPFWIGERDTTGRSRQRTFDALNWLKEHELPVRGHVFVWPASKRLPKKVAQLIGTPRQNEIPGMVLDHIRDISTATAGLVSEWDVLNEPFNNHELMDIFGKEIMVDWFKTAREVLGPDVPLYFNDWGNHELAGDPTHVKHFVDTAKFILSRGGPIDGLGLQCHIGGVPPAPESLLATLDHYQKELGLKIRATEFDFTTDDRELHAQYSRDFLIAYFSHPSVAGIQFWGFWEKAHWRPQAALYDKDWNETPAGTAVRKLIRETWWTRANGETDGSGRYAARGFHGRYLLRVTLGDRAVEQEIRILPGTTPTAIDIVLP